jgi:hypothetical protein
MQAVKRWGLLFCAVLGCSPAVPAQGPEQTKRLARDIFKQLIEINTTDSLGNVTTAADAMAKRLREGGFVDSDIHVDGPNERKKNLVVRLHGTGKRKPILFIGHLDVVEARHEDWTTDPFEFIEKDGYFYLEFRSNDLDFDGTGTVVLGGALTLDVVSRFSKAISDELVQETHALSFRQGADGRLSVPLQIRGTVREPRVQLDLNRVINEGVLNEVKKLLGR